MAILKLVDIPDGDTALVPANEKERQTKLDEYDILDTLPEDEFDSLVELAALITGSPISLMNLLDHNRQWTKAVYGTETGNTPRSDTVCQYTIMGNENFEIHDLSKDEHFKDMDYVENDPKYRSYSGYPLRTPDGFNIGALCVLDYKPKKLSKVQKKALRTIADEIIARLELRKKQRELENLNCEKDLFLSAVNHDIKSPLNGIISSANYLLNNWGGDQDELRDFLSMIEMSGRKLIHYIGELISNSLRQGESKLLLDEVELKPLIDDLIHIYKPVAESKKIELNTKLNASKPFRLDNEKFKLILSNLISNALKFSHAGDTVSVTIEIRGDKERSLHCKISDTGVGIPKKFIPTLFEKKKIQQRQGTAGEISTGMGLPVVKQFVELHNGSIDVKSKENTETTIYIILPENK